MEDNDDRLTWRKARASAADNGCVETASRDGVVLVRDTKARERGHLAVSAESWSVFVTELKNKTNLQTARSGGVAPSHSAWPALLHVRVAVTCWRFGKGELG